MSRLAAPTTRTPVDRKLINGTLYRGSFARYLREPGLTPDEIRNMAAGVTSASGGGYLVPEEFLAKLTVRVKRSSAMVRACNVIRTDTGGNLAWPTADDTSNVGAIVAENTQVSEQDIVFGEHQLGAYMYSSKVIRASIQLTMDTSGLLENWLSGVFGRRIARGMNPHFTIGTGVGQPTGLIPTATVGVTGSTGSTTSITYDNVVSMIESVDAEYLDVVDDDSEQPDGFVGWMGSSAALSMLRKVKDGQGKPIVTEGRPVEVLGYPYMVNNDVPVPAASAKSLAFGNFGAGYLIRQVNDSTQIVHLKERYADSMQEGWIGFSRWDGTPDDPYAIRVYQHSAT